jgi:hypothetical protein
LDAAPVTLIPNWTAPLCGLAYVLAAGVGVVGSGGRPASHHPAQDGAGLGTGAAQGLAVHGHIDDRQADVRQGIGCRYRCSAAAAWSPQALSITYRQLPSAWRRATSAVVAPMTTGLPSGPVPLSDQVLAR